MRYILLIAAVTLTACAGNVQSLKSAADTENIDPYEQRLWHQAKKYDEIIRKSGQLYENHDREIAVAYLQEVMDRLYPEFKGVIRVDIVDATSLNAFALPNGSIYFHLGLLARVENEAQLSTILAHEGAHFVLKHSYRHRIYAKNATAFGSTLAIAGVPFADLAAISSVYGFSREVEQEADKLGYERMVKAGYDPREAHKTFEHLAAEVNALEIKEPYFFASHPKLLDRIENFKQLSADYSGKGDIGEDKFLEIDRSVRMSVLQKDLSLNRYQRIILVLENERTRSKFPPAAYYYLGEAYRRRGNEGDMEKAIDSYKKAIVHEPNFYHSYRALGIQHFKKKDFEKANYLFNKYLELAPENARGRAYVQQYISTIKNRGEI